LKKLAFLGAALGLGVGAFVATHSQAADHLDSPSAIANPMADITDVYAWMGSGADSSKVNLIMDVSPGDPGTRHFDNTVQYVWHVNSVADFSSMTPTETKVICTFASDTSIQCWVGNKDYVKGDPSSTSGLKSADGKIRVFAGRRSDPFFFNFNGFEDAVATVKGAAAGNMIGGATPYGCPLLTKAQAAGVQALLQEPAVGSARTHAPCSGSDADCFARLDVMAIVVQVDKSLLNSGSNTLIKVWGSTHATP
jgi:hypothetical protein